MVGKGTKCEGSGSRRGLYAETWSGDYAGATKNMECDVSGTSRTSHCVRILNLKTYDLDVKIEGEIKSTFNKAKFIPRGKKDTERYWVDKYIGLLDKQEKVFDHIEITIEGTQKGTEKIEATVTGDWAEPEEQRIIALAFDVTT